MRVPRAVGLLSAAFALCALAALWLGTSSPPLPVVWHAAPIPVLPDEAERPGIVAAARRAGLIDPVNISLSTPAFGCPGAVAETEPHDEGVRRTRLWLYLERRTPAGNCAPPLPGAEWVAGPVEESTEWLVERHGTRLWITLLEYMTGDGQQQTVSYDDARRVTVAFIDGQVDDSRAFVTGGVTPPPLPRRDRATHIRAVASDPRGWEVTTDDNWTFTVVFRRGRFVVVDSGYPIA